jgi:hypothetical protein
MVMYNVHIWGSWVKSIQEIFALFVQLFGISKIISKYKVLKRREKEKRMVELDCKK